jgi:hypothetical protein
MRAAGGGGPIDPFFKNTVLLLHGDGTNGGQNNTFIDSSTNNFTVTRNGNPTQGSFTPFSAPDGYWSVYSGASNSRLSTTSTGILDVGTGDFTIEAWVYLVDPLTNQYQNIFTYNFSGGTVYIRFTDSGFGNKLQVSVNGVFSSGMWSCPVTSTSVKGRWVHLALSRGSNVCRLFVDGVLQNIQNGVNPSTYPFTSFTSNESIGNQTTCEFVGYASGNYSFNGYVSNLRVVKSCLYTSTFTPETTPLQPIANTTLLTCQSNRFIDNSGTGKVITATLLPRVTAFSPLASLKEYNSAANGGSVYLDGLGDWLICPNNSLFNLAEDGTVEAWVYAFAEGGMNVCAKRIVAADGYVLNTNGIRGVVNGSFSNSVLTWTAPPPFTWNHIAFVKSGTTLTVYINGVQVAQRTDINSMSGSDTNFIVGAQTVGGEGPANGYISNLRFTTGVSLYSGAFSPPTSPLPPVSGTSLLLNNTNASIIDSTGKNVIETIANAQIDTTIKKYGTGSLEFDGSGDILFCPSSPDFSLGTSNFTIEGWFYFNDGTTNADRIIWSNYASSFTTGSIYFGKHTIVSGRIALWVWNFNSGSPLLTDPSALPNNTWVHLAVVRNGNAWTLYRDGTSVATTTFTGTSTLNFISYVGGNSNNNTFNGYIDDFRITNGVARYTSNFTPSTAPFENR